MGKGIEIVGVLLAAAGVFIAYETLTAGSSQAQTSSGSSGGGDTYNDTYTYSTGSANIPYVTSGSSLGNPTPVAPVQVSGGQLSILAGITPLNNNSLVNTEGALSTVTDSNGNTQSIQTGGNVSYTSAGIAPGTSVAAAVANPGTLSNINFNGGNGGVLLAAEGTVLKTSVTTNAGTVVPAGATFLGNGQYFKGGTYYS